MRQRDAGHEIGLLGRSVAGFAAVGFPARASRTVRVAVACFAVDRRGLAPAACRSSLPDAFAARSRTTSLAFLSTRRPWNDGCRSAPSRAPFGERDFGDEIGPHPVRALRLEAARRIRRTAASLALALLASSGASVAQRRLVEAGADLARIAQLAVVVDAEQQRAEARARALRVGVAADDHLLPLHALHLHPVARARAGGVDANRRACRRCLRARARTPGGRNRRRRRALRGRAAPSPRRCRRSARSSRLRSVSGDVAQIVAVEIQRDRRRRTRGRSPGRPSARSAAPGSSMRPSASSDDDLAVDPGARNRQRGEIAAPPSGMRASSPCRCATRGARGRARCGRASGSRRT